MIKKLKQLFKKKKPNANEWLILYAFRYALGRKLPGPMANYLLSIWFDLSPTTRRMICEEIILAIDHDIITEPGEISVWEKVIEIDNRR